MSQDDDSPTTSKALIEREISESIIRAQKALNKHADLRQRVAMAGKDPRTHHKVRNAHRQVDVATLNAFELLRNYARDDIDDYWNTKVVGTYKGDFVVFGAPPEKELKDGEVVSQEKPDNVRYLSEFYNTVERNTRIEHIRFEGKRTVVDVSPVLLPISAYEQTVQLLLDVLKENEFTPKPPTQDIEETEVL